jgi:hypothetical protein
MPKSEHWWSARETGGVGGRLSSSTTWSRGRCITRARRTPRRLVGRRGRRARGWGHSARRARDGRRNAREESARPCRPRADGRTPLAQVKTLGWIRFGLEFILSIRSIIDGGFGWRRYVVPCKTYGTGSFSQPVGSLSSSA